MSRTERDVMRGKRIAILADLHVQERQRAAAPRYQRDLVHQEYEDTLRVNHVYQHYCSPYCLIHEFKRVHRKQYRQRVKDALRHGDWFEAQHLRPRDLGK